MRNTPSRGTAGTNKSGNIMAESEAVLVDKTPAKDNKSKL